MGWGGGGGGGGCCGYSGYGVLIGEGAPIPAPLNHS